MEKISFKLMSLAVCTVVLIGILENSAFVLAQTPQSSASNTNTTINANNSTAIGTPVGENSTINTSTVQLSCGPQSNTTAGAAAAENATATASNSSATAPSSNISAGSADSNSTTTSGTANSTIDTILITIGEARTHILQGCDAANNSDTQMILFHFNEVARALDNIEGNLTMTNSATGDNGTEDSSSTQSNGQQNTTRSSQGSATSSPPIGADQ